MARGCIVLARVAGLRECPSRRRGLSDLRGVQKKMWYLQMKAVVLNRHSLADTLIFFLGEMLC